MIGMGGGLVLEIAGYVGRIQLHANPFELAVLYSESYQYIMNDWFMARSDVRLY
jgi:hypothetical protein